MISRSLRIFGALALTAGFAIVAAPAPAVAAPSAAPEKSMAEAEMPSPETFDDFNDAVAHAKKEDKFVVLVCLKTNHPESLKLRQLLDGNDLFLSASKIAVFQYNVENDARVESFKTHFNLKDAKSAPIMVVADSWGKPLASRSGFLGTAKYQAFVKSVAGSEAIELPPESFFNVKKEDVVGSVDLTESRTWTTVEGRRFTGVLMEAKGSTGIFRTTAGNVIEVGFNALSKPDVAYLEKVKVIKGGATTTGSPFDE